MRIMHALIAQSAFGSLTTSLAKISNGDSSMRRSLVAAASLACLLVGAAQAETTANGISVNGISFNGISVNGISVNGISVNGISFNGISVNGGKVNGSAAASTGMRVQGMTVQGGRLVYRAR